MAVCGYCKNYYRDGSGAGNYNGVYFCSGSCMNAYIAEVRARDEAASRASSSSSHSEPQTVYVQGTDYSSEISSMQSELNRLRQEQAERQQQEEERRQQEQERDEHLGKCAWCGKQNEQVYMNQLWFPARKFCSKKCLFDAKAAENPAVRDEPYITAQKTGNVFTSIKEAFEWSKNGDTLVFSKGVFEIPKDFNNDFNNGFKGFNIKAENNDMNLPLSERTVFKIQKCGLWIREGTSFIDGIVFDGVDKKYSGFINNHIDGLIVKKCVFMNLKNGADAGVDDIFENCLFINCTYGIASRLYYNSYNAISQIKLSGCTFDSVKYALSYGGPKAQLYDSVLKNSLPNPFVDVPVDNAQCCNMRTNKMYSYLQAAIDDAQDGDTIVLAPGKHHGGFVIANKKNLTIKAAVTNLSAGESQLSTITDCHSTDVWKGQNITFEGIVFNAPSIAYCFEYDDDFNFLHNVKFSGCRFIGLEDGILQYSALENCEIPERDALKWDALDFENYLTWMEKTKTDWRYAPYYAIEDCCAYVHVADNCLTADGKTALAFGLEVAGNQFSKVLSAGADDKTASVVFSTPTENQTGIAVKICVAPTNKTKSLSECSRLGSYDFSGIKPMPKGAPQISVHFEAVNNHWLKIWVTEENGNVTTGDMAIENALKLTKATPAQNANFNASNQAVKAKKAKPAVCKNCGAPLKEGKKFCTKCGTKI